VQTYNSSDKDTSFFKSAAEIKYSQNTGSANSSLPEQPRDLHAEHMNAMHIAPREFETTANQYDNFKMYSEPAIDHHS